MIHQASRDLITGGIKRVVNMDESLDERDRSVSDSKETLRWLVNFMRI